MIFIKFQRIFEKNYHKWNYKFLEKIQEDNNQSNTVFDFIGDIEKKHNFQIDDQKILDLIFKKASSKQNIFGLLFNN